MSCVIGLEHNDQVFIGGDSCATRGHESLETRLPKVFIRGKFIIGYTGSFRMGQLLQHVLSIPERHEHIEPIVYMVVNFVPTVIECFDKNGYTPPENSCLFLVGHSGLLFNIDSDYQVNSFKRGYQALGSGEEYAMGYMRARENDTPLDRILGALETASDFCNSVQGPHQVLSL